MDPRRLFGFLLLVLPWVPGQAGVRSELRQGQQAYAAGDFPASSGYFGEALAHDPDNPEAHFNLGASAFRQGDLESAASRFARVAEQQDPAWSSKGWYNLGNTRLQQQDPAGAVEAYTKALKQDPGLEQARWNLELALRQLQQQQQQSSGEDGESQDSEQNDSSQQDKQGGQDSKDSKDSKGQQGQQDQKGQQGQQTQGKQGDPEPGEQGQAQPGEEGQAQDSSAQAMPVSPEQLKQILQAVSQQEKSALQKQLQQQQPAGGRRVEKDW